MIADNVDIKDREAEVEYLRMALSMAEFYVNYESTELILQVYSALKVRNEHYNIMDSVDIHHRWREKWTEYWKQKKEEKQ